MMKTILTLFGMGLILVGGGRAADTRDNLDWIMKIPTNYPRSVSMLYHTNPASLSLGTNFLTISNGAWFGFHSALVIRATDAEWALITNKFRPEPSKSALLFYDPPMIYRPSR